MRWAYVKSFTFSTAKKGNDISPELVKRSVCICISAIHTFVLLVFIHMLMNALEWVTKHRFRWGVSSQWSKRLALSLFPDL